MCHGLAVMSNTNSYHFLPSLQKYDTTVSPTKGLVRDVPKHWWGLWKKLCMSASPDDNLWQELILDSVTAISVYSLNTPKA